MWLKKRRELGPQALRKQRQGRPAGKKKISRDQARQVARLVLDKTPGQLKLPFMLWTREAVRDLVRERTGVTAMSNKGIQNFRVVDFMGLPHQELASTAARRAAMGKGRVPKGSGDIPVTKHRDRRSLPPGKIYEFRIGGRDLPVPKSRPEATGALR